MDTREIIKASMGEIKADLILRGGKIVNVYTREILGNDVVITKGIIVHVGQETKLFEGENTIIQEIQGKYVCPGLIESHIHIESSMLTLTEFSKVIMPRGTTTVVIDPHEIVNVTGIQGLELLIEEASNSPIRFLIEAPSCVPSLPGFETSGAIINSKVIDELMQRKEIFALAEMMNYPGVIMGLPEVVNKIESAKAAGKIIEGHAPLLTGKELQTYIAAGISSDHEATSFTEALEKLRLGMKLQIREGSFAKDLETILAELPNHNIDTRNILAASDDRNAVDLFEKGHLDYTLKLMVKLGINPVEAVQMLTLNVATHLGLQNKIGGIAPGKIADLIVVDNLSDFNVKLTIINGKIVYKDGQISFTPKKIEYPSFILNTVKNLEIPNKTDLLISTFLQEKARVRVIGLREQSLITDKLESKLEVKGGFVIPDIHNDILPIVVVNRHTKERKIGKSFVKGLKLKNSALASTVAHDSHQLICTGTDYDLMVEAIKALKESKGGQILVTPEKSTLLPLEFAGIMSTLPVEDVVEKLQHLLNDFMEIGSQLSDPFMALAFLALPVIPHLKITDHGLIDVDEFRIVDPFIKEE